MGITPKAEVLPFEFPCPFNCQGTIKIYDDYNTNGAWAYCNTCKFAGDMVELVIKFWDLPTFEGIKKLATLSEDISPVVTSADRIKLYEHWHVHRRRRLQTLFKQSQNRLMTDNSITLRDLQQKLGIRRSQSDTRVLENCREFIGANDRNGIMALLEPIRRETGKGIYPAQSYSSTATVLGGGNWTNVIVIPMYDMPGRIKAYMFYGRSGRYPQDIRVILMRYNSEMAEDKEINLSTAKDTDPGIALYSVIEHAKDTLFVTNNIVQAIKLQVRHFQDHGTPAPLVSMYDNQKFRTNPAIWRAIDKKLVFWGAPDALLFRHAKATNSLISTVGFDEEEGELWTNLRRAPLVDWLNRAEKGAKPWENVFERFVATLSPDEAEKLIINTELTNEERTRLIKSSSAELKLRIEGSYKERPKTIYINGEKIIETDKGWTTNASGGLVSNAIIRIENVIYYKRLDQIYYEGYVIMNSEVVPFLENSNVLASSPFKRLQHLLIRSHVGYLDIPPNWDPYIINIAVKFHPPIVKPGFDSVGWDKEESCFVFPEYIIDSCGNVSIDKTIKTNKTRTPCLEAKHPEDLTTEDRNKLIENEGASVLWALTTAIAANILAPVFGIKEKMICISELELLRKYTIALGCAEYTVREQLRRPEEETLVEICEEHNWPIYLRPTDRVTIDDLNLWLTDGMNRNCVIPINEYRMNSLLTRKDRLGIVVNKVIETTDITSVVMKIMPSFLQYIAKHRFNLPAEPIRYTDKINAMICKWFEGQGGDSSIISNSMELLVDYTDEQAEKRITHLMKLVCRFMANGELSVIRDEFITKGEKIDGIVITRKHGVFISNLLINTLLTRHGAPTIDSAVITEDLKIAKLGDRRDYAGLSGWTVKEDWFNKHLLPPKDELSID